ncbi:MAG: hypothetical protein N3C63_06300 [Rhodocyclaceae bacterium]|nr:hypothetical protein [Rhodocyclaceae bacterium]
MKALLALLSCVFTLAHAHEVHREITVTPAVVITLSYANGAPFAYEKYTLTASGEATPRQVGNTDAAGRISFVPGDVETWHLVATSADGHGVSEEIRVPALGNSGATAAALPRWLMALAGLSLIFGLFGLWQLFVKGKR